MLNSEREKVSSQTIWKLAERKKMVVFDNRLFDTPGDKTFEKCRAEAAGEMRSHAWFLKHSDDPPQRSIEVDLNKEQATREKETWLDYETGEANPTGFRLHDGKNFIHVLYLQQYVKPAPKGLSLGHREKAVDESESYIADVRSETVDDIALRCSYEGRKEKYLQLAYAGYAREEIAHMLEISARTADRIRREIRSELESIPRAKSERPIADRVSPLPSGWHPNREFSEPSVDGHRLPFRAANMEVLASITTVEPPDLSPWYMALVERLAAQFGTLPYWAEWLNLNAVLTAKTTAVKAAAKLVSAGKAPAVIHTAAEAERDAAAEARWRLETQAYGLTPALPAEPTIFHIPHRQTSAEEKAA
jgi:hypothetical protein